MGDVVDLNKGKDTIFRCECGDLLFYFCRDPKGCFYIQCQHCKEQIGLDELEEEIEGEVH